MAFGKNTMNPSVGRRSISANVLVVVLVVLALACVSVYSREGQTGPVHSVQSAAGMVAAPVQFLGAGVAYAEDAVVNAVENARVSDETYTALLQENEQLRTRIVELEEYQAEAQRLQGLLDLRDRYGFEGITGRVIGMSPDAWNRVITLDVGSSDGVEMGLPAIGSTGIVGQVIEVNPTSCRVRLLADPKSGVSVLIQSNRQSGIVYGSIEGLLYLEDVDSSVNVQIGDVLITSGLGGTYYRGIPLGTVVNVSYAAGSSTRTVIVSPFSEADPLEEITVMTGMTADKG